MSESGLNPEVLRLSALFSWFRASPFSQGADLGWAVFSYEPGQQAQYRLFDTRGRLACTLAVHERSRVEGGVGSPRVIDPWG